MKKIMINTAIALSIVLLSGCGITDKSKQNSSNNTKVESGTKVDEKTSPEKEDTNKTPVNTEESSETRRIKDYLPTAKDVKFIYEGSGNEYASYTTWVDYLKDDRVQVRTNNGGTETVEVIKYEKGELKVVFSQDETYYREDLTAKASNKNEILLKEPLVKGTSWKLKDGSKRYISNNNVEITTPSGSYKTIEVTTENKNYKNLDYYAPNVGLVKTIYKSKDMEVSSTLSKIEKNSHLVQEVKFYYPNMNDGAIYFANRKVSFKTNDITKITIEKNLKELPKGDLGKVLTKNVKIKSLYLGKEKMVYVDFSKELVSEMNAGAGYEVMILDCITNTLGEYYGVDKVYITVENKPYSSGHIEKEKGEYFEVNTKGVIGIQ
jgi:spore germination protein GerM